MASRWTPPDPSVPRSAPLRDPPLVSSAERERRLRERGVPENLLQLLDEPERALEHALRPDPEVATDLEHAHGGVALLATNELQDMFLVLTDDGEWVEIQLDDGVAARYERLPLALASLVITAWEEERPEADCIRFARTLGLRDPEALVDALEAAPRATFEADEEWRRTVLPTLV